MQSKFDGSPDAPRERSSKARIKSYSHLARAGVRDTIDGVSDRAESNAQICPEKEPEMLILALTWAEIGFAALLAYALLSIIIVKK